MNWVQLKIELKKTKQQDIHLKGIIMKNRTWLGLLLVGLVLVLGMMLMQGCSDDPADPDPGPDPVDLPASTTPHILMNNFKTVNEDMYIEGYEHIINEDHRIIVLQETFDAWEGSDNPLEHLYFDQAQAIAIAENMFSGQDGVNEAGIAIPSVESIDIAVLDLQGTWEPVDEATDYFGDFENVQFAAYSVVIYFNNPNYHRYQIDQTLVFYAVDVSGGEQNDWQLLGIVPIGWKSSSATEQISYDSVLSLYR